MIAAAPGGWMLGRVPWVTSVLNVANVPYESSWNPLKMRRSETLYSLHVFGREEI